MISLNKHARVTFSWSGHTTIQYALLIGCLNSLFLVEISGNTGRNAFLTSIASQKIFRPYFQKSRLEYYFLCLFYFSSPYSGHLRSDFVVLLLLLTARCRRTRKADQKCPEKQDKKSKRDMKKMFTVVFTQQNHSNLQMASENRLRNIIFDFYSINHKKSFGNLIK